MRGGTVKLRHWAVCAAALTGVFGCRVGQPGATDADAAKDVGGDVAIEASPDGGAMLDGPAEGPEIAVSHAPTGCGTSGWCPVLTNERGTQDLLALWGSGPRDVWAVGDGVLKHWDGERWSTSGAFTATFYSVWGSGPKDVWAVGDETVIHWDGESWSRVSAPMTDVFVSVWGSADDDVWILGRDGALLRWNGGGWATAMRLPSRGETNYPSDFRAVWGTAKNDVWILSDVQGDSRRWNGAEIVAFPGMTIAGSAIAGSGPTDVWVVGAGKAHHWDGQTWSEFLKDELTTNAWLSLWVTTKNDVWLATGALGLDPLGPHDVHDLGSLRHWNGVAWSEVPLGGLAPLALTAVWASGPDDVWAAGPSGQLVHGGAGGSFTNWLAVSELDAVAGSGPDDAWAVGTDGTGARDAILHWDGATWSVATSGTTPALTGVWARSTRDAWAVGRAGTIRHWNGAAWVASPAPGIATDLTAVWGSAADDVWAVGAGGTVLHGNGTTWEKIDAGTTVDLDGVWGTGARDVWIVGGTIRHWDGTAWAPAATAALVSSFGYPIRIRGVWASGPFDVWFVGTPAPVSPPAQAGGLQPPPAPPATLVYYWNGVAVSTVSTWPVERPTAVWGSDASNVWVVGELGTVSRWDGFAWTKGRLGASESLTAIGGTGRTDAWLVGARGSIWHR